MNTFGLSPAFVIDEHALAEAIREVFASMDDADIDEKATAKQMLAIAEAYVRRLREIGEKEVTARARREYALQQRDAEP